jgi:hypothetical protein
LGDWFDIIYADASDEALSRYAYLIDADPTGAFAKAKNGRFKIIESTDVCKLEADLRKLAKEIMPVYVDDLCWLVSADENGCRYLSVFNNDGNERSLRAGNRIDGSANRRVTISFKEKTTPHVLKAAGGDVSLEKMDDTTYQATIPAAGFAIIRF